MSPSSWKNSVPSSYPRKKAANLPVMKTWVKVWLDVRHCWNKVKVCKIGFYREISKKIEKGVETAGNLTKVFWLRTPQITVVIWPRSLICYPLFQNPCQLRENRAKNWRNRLPLLYQKSMKFKMRIKQSKRKITIRPEHFLIRKMEAMVFSKVNWTYRVKDQ